MKPLRARLQETRHRLGLPWEVIERDYLLSWILAGITRSETLRNTLVFNSESFFPEAILKTVEKTWDQWLGPLVPNLTPYQRVIDELRPMVKDLI